MISPIVCLHYQEQLESAVLLLLFFNRPQSYWQGGGGEEGGVLLLLLPFFFFFWLVALSLLKVEQEVTWVGNDCYLSSAAQLTYLR